MVLDSLDTPRVAPVVKSAQLKAVKDPRGGPLHGVRVVELTKVWAGPVNDARGSAHNRGSCRMGTDPKTSVVNKHHRAHDVPNLFIVDGSTLVTGGRNHPTMTIQALAFRAAEHIARAARTGTLASL